MWSRRETWFMMFFFKLWQRGDIPEVSNVRSWIYTVVYNQCIDVIRRRNLHEQYVHKSQKEHIYEASFFETEVIREDVYAMLDKAIQSLPERSREVILLKLKGYKNSEIGEKLNISVNTVNTLKSNAYKALRSKLQKDSLLSFTIFYLLFVY